MKRKAVRRKNLTILIAPDDNTRIFSFKINAPVFYSLIFILAAGLVFSVWIITKHVNYRATAAFNKYLIFKDKNFSGEVVKARNAIDRTSNIDAQLRSILKLRNRSGILSNAGTGPGNPKIKTDNDIISADSFRLAANSVDQEQRSKEKSFQQIIKYISDQRLRLSAVPSGWPVRGWISAGFGARMDPFTGEPAFHEGVDIVNDVGTPVKATADGVVSSAGFERGYGNILCINHFNGYSTRYGHLLKYVVSQGEYVKKGQLIGYLGNSGHSTAPHTHYEVRLNGVAVNPMKFLAREIALK